MADGKKRSKSGGGVSVSSHSPPVVAPPECQEDLENSLRLQAEGVARQGCPVEATTSCSAIEFRRLLHELQVHQIELQVQNENLRLNQEELAEERDRYFDFYDNAPVGYLTLDRCGMILAANLTIAVLLGQFRGQLLKRPITAFICREDHDTYYLSHKNVFLTQENQSCELRMLGKNDREFWALIKAAAGSESGGQPTCNVVIADISERKQAELALKNLSLYNRSLIEANLDPLVTIDPSGKITDVNSATEQVTGYLRHQLIGTDFSDYFTEPAKARLGYQQAFEEGSVRDYPLEIRSREGRLISVLYNARVYHDNTGKISGVLAAARDITRRKQAEEALKASNENLERRVEERTRELQETQRQVLHAEKLSAIGQLSASISHEFNNPLQGILSILRGLKKRAILEEEDRELLEAAISESNRIKTLIHSLQDFNRPSTGKKVLLDIHATLDSMLLMQKCDFRHKGIRLVLDYGDHLPHIMAVPDQIKQVFLNLLSNAADACQPNGGIITITTRLDKGRIMAAVTDNGIGIEPEAFDLLFQPFYTTKPDVKGTGLGLPVSYGIVRNHGGEILVESQPGKGSTFTVVLPVSAVAGAGPATADDPDQTEKQQKQPVTAQGN